jgi:nucleoside-diphosphate-sugar epimerase
MRFLLTGAAGFIGGHVTRQLKEHGHSVRAFDVRERDTGADEWIVGDLRDLEVLERAVDGVDRVIHLAAIPASRPRDEWPSVVDVNVRGTYLLMEAMARQGIRNVVFASSACVLGGVCNWKYRPLPKYLPFDEESLVETDEPYSLSKIVNEQTAMMFVRHGFFDAAIAMRFWNVRDAVTHGLGILHHPTVLFATVHPHDAAQAVRLAALSPLTGFHAFSVSSRWRYNADGTRESPETTRQLIRLAFPHGVELREGFPEIWGSAGSSAKLRAILGYEPDY